jgi:hypothetical protein
MANTQVVYDFLNSIANKQVTTSLPPDDLALLQKLNLVTLVGNDQYVAAQQAVANLDAARAQLGQEESARARLAYNVQGEAARTHSIRFLFEGHDKKAADLQRVQQDRAALQAETADEAAREQQFDQLLQQKSMLDTLVPYAGGYVGLSGAGQLQLREMSVRLYRASDVGFATYIQQSQQVTTELNELSDRGAMYAQSLGGPLNAYDKSQVWGVSIGLAKLQPNVAQGAQALLNAWSALDRLTSNPENRLMSAEIVTAVPAGLDASVPELAALEKEVRRLNVPKESSLGVASLLLLGRRADGTYATGNLPSFLQVTRSYESAALMAIVNRPLADLTQKFSTLRGLFASWGFADSEDVELASAFLTLSDLPVEGLDTKLGIITRGMGQYLQFPLVASAILAAIPVLEANETLSLLEQAYGVVGRRAMPMSEPEMICLAVRLIHGIRDETIGQLDTTAAARAAAVTPGYMYGPRFFFAPVIVAHGSYFSTYSGIGGIHPGHAHVMGGGFGG